MHYTHYGRLCPIESPEGPNIGLISSLCVYAKINNLGFIETPYRKVNNSIVDIDPEHIIYMSAEEEEAKIIGQGNAPLTEDGHFIRKVVKCRKDADYPVVPPSEVDLVDVAPQQIASMPVNKECKVPLKPPPLTLLPPQILMGAQLEAHKHNSLFPLLCIKHRGQHGLSARGRGVAGCHACIRGSGVQPLLGSRTRWSCCGLGTRTTEPLPPRPCDATPVLLFGGPEGGLA